MTAARRPADELLDVTGVLLLLQGAILIATTIEAAVWGLAFAAPTASVALSAAAALALLVGRIRLRAGRPWSRRLVYAVEVAIVVTLAIDVLLAVLITGAPPPAVAVLTRLVLPLAVIALLHRATAPRPVPASAQGAA